MRVKSVVQILQEHREDLAICTRGTSSKELRALLPPGVRIREPPEGHHKSLHGLYMGSNLHLFFVRQMPSSLPGEPSAMPSTSRRYGMSTLWKRNAVQQIVSEYMFSKLQMDTRLKGFCQL